MPGIASAATAVALGLCRRRHLDDPDRRRRDHAAQSRAAEIAEQFGTLESLFPGRIDLGLGRAPGTDQAAAYALRRNLNADVNHSRAMSSS